MSGELLGAEQRCACRRELNRQREPVEPAADLGDRAGVAQGQLQIVVMAASALDEQGSGRCLVDHFWPIIPGDLERRQHIAMLGLQPERLATGGQHLQPRTGRQQLAHQRRSGK